LREEANQWWTRWERGLTDHRVWMDYAVAVAEYTRAVEVITVLEGMANVQLGLAKQKSAEWFGSRVAPIQAPPQP
jgi:hypothetical protein